MSEVRSWYDVLGVAPTATDDELRAAHRTLSKASHPDAGGSAGEFQLVQTAYEVLSDPDRRAEHDRELRGPAPVAAPAAGPSRRPGPAARPASAPVAPPPPPATGCLTPWVAIAGGVAVVVAVLVTIATLSSSPGPSAGSGSSLPSAAGGGAAPGGTAPTAAPAAAAAAAGTVRPGTVTTVQRADLPPAFPRGHVPLPVSSQVRDVTIAGSDRGPVTYTIRATGPGTDADRAAVNYAASLQAAGWTSEPDEDPAIGVGDSAQRSMVDSNGARLRFSVSESAGGVDYVIGFAAGRG